MKKNGKLIMVALFLSGFVVACANGDQKMETHSTESVGANDDLAYFSNIEHDVLHETVEGDMGLQEGGAESEFDESIELDRKLIKNAHLNFETDSLASRKKIVDEAVKQFSAYVQHEEQYASSDRETVTTTVRVPSENFEGFMEAVCVGVGMFDSKTIAVDDVTEEYVDVEARIKTKKELKARFTALLDKAETIKKIMEIEREIAALQAEIESYEGRLKYLSGGVKYATVDISYYRLLDVPTEFDNKFENAFSNGWEGFVWFFVGLVSIWPLLVIIAVMLIIIRMQIRRRKARLS